MNQPLLGFSEINCNMLNYRKRIIDGVNIIFCSAKIDLEFKINHEPITITRRSKIQDTKYKNKFDWPLIKIV